MEIYTAAQRLSHSFRVGDEPLSIGHYGTIGDGHTCALVGVDGSVDWLCLPRFDSPSVFAKLLDAERGGSFRVSPQERPFERLQAYDDATNVLQTLFRRPGEGVVVVTDLMPWNGDPRSSLHELLRLVEGREGTLDLEVLFDPRFDYGRGEPRIEMVEQPAQSPDFNLCDLAFLRALACAVRKRRRVGPGKKRSFDLKELADDVKAEFDDYPAEKIEDMVQYLHYVLNESLKTDPKGGNDYPRHRSAEAKKRKI